MDLNEKSQSYEEFIKGPFQTILQEIETLVTAEDPPTQLFKSKYRANEIIVFTKLNFISFSQYFFCLLLIRIIQFYFFFL